MRHPTFPRPRASLAALLALLFAAAATPSARAQVQDEAGFFSSDAVTRATQTIDRIKREHGKDLRIETYASIPSNLQADFQRLGKDPFYEQWAQQRGKTLGLDGMLVLITREPPRIQIQVGRATREKAFTQPNREELFKVLSNRFKAKEYDDGLMDAADYVYRQMGQNLRASQGAAGRTGAAAGSATGSGAGAGSGSGTGYPPPPGGSAGSSSGTNRTSTAPPGAGRPGGLACGGGMGSMLCLIIGIIGAVMLIRGVFARRSAGYGQGPGVPPNAPYGQPGYGGGYGGMGGGMGGGGFGRGMLGGLLGGVLGGWAYDKMGGRSHDAGAAGMGGAAGGGLPPTDPSTFDSGSTGGDFGGGGGGSADFGGGGGGDFGGGGGDFGGGGGGGDSGSSGGDF
jgi:uncharacterized protein